MVFYLQKDKAWFLFCWKAISYTTSHFSNMYVQNPHNNSEWMNMNIKYKIHGWWSEKMMKYDQNLTQSIDDFQNKLKSNSIKLDLWLIIRASKFATNLSCICNNSLSPSFDLSFQLERIHGFQLLSWLHRHFNLSRRETTIKKPVFFTFLSLNGDNCIVTVKR